MDFHFVVRDVKGDVARLQKIIREVTFDYISAISAADHKIAHTTGGINLHDVPQNGFASDFNHRLWPEIALLTDSRTHASCKNHGFHGWELTLSIAASAMAVCSA
jgi:hypothetical protein